MGVDVQTLGGSRVVRTFADTFNRASGGLGTTWIWGNTMFTPAATPAQLQAAAITASALDGLQCLRWSSQNGAANPNWVLFGFAIPLLVYPGDLNKTQFVQCTVVNATGAGVERSNCGLATMLCINIGAGSGISCYYLEALPQINVLQLGRYRSGNTVDFTAPFGGIAGGVANGDVLRMSTEIQSTQCVITITKNGTVVGTVTDNSASRLSLGSPGFFVRGSGGVNPGFHEWRNFSCGVGL